MQPPFTPDGYVAGSTGRTQVWKRAGANAEPCESVLDEVIASIETCLEFRLGCELHLVIYDSNADAQAALRRAVPANMLLAPLQTAAVSIVAVQSTAAHSANGDLERMRRHLSHEFAHIAAALRTGSEKCLGDHDRAMQILPWVNEGFACVVAALVCDRRDRLDRDLARATHAYVADLNAALNDLVDANRSTAFSIATARVWRAVQAQGLSRVFATLEQPDLWQEQQDSPEA